MLLGKTKNIKGKPAIRLYINVCVQCEHLFASTGISLKHSLHFFVVGLFAISFFDFEMRKFIGLITKKKIVEAISRNDIRVFKKWPYINLLSLIVKNSPDRSGILATAEMKGVMRSVTSEFTIEPNDAPITTPTARSTTFPLSKNCLNSFSIFCENYLAPNFYHHINNNSNQSKTDNSLCKKGYCFFFEAIEI